MILWFPRLTVLPSQGGEEVCTVVTDLERQANLSRTLFNKQVAEIRAFQPIVSTGILILIITG